MFTFSVNFVFAKLPKLSNSNFVCCFEYKLRSSLTRSNPNPTQYTMPMVSNQISTYFPPRCDYLFCLLIFHLSDFRVRDAPKTTKKSTENFHFLFSAAICCCWTWQSVKHLPTSTCYKL